MTEPVRVAMWSGPRNLSTAMMYSFAARSDCAVWDEPFYAAFLSATGLDHPMRAETLARHDADPGRVAAACSGQIPHGKSLFYQKHMAHHMLPGFPMGWARACRNVVLLRHPARVVASYVRKRESPTFLEIGFERLCEVFDQLTDLTGSPPPVFDSFDIRTNPEGVMRRLCAVVGIPFDLAMLSWKAGPRAEDGAWAPHWYGAVHRSTGFEPPEGDPPVLDGEAARLVEKALPFYERLRAFAVQAA